MRFMATYQNIDHPYDFRLGVLRVLEKEEISRSELARRVQAHIDENGDRICERQTVLRFLRGETNPSCVAVSLILAELGMRVHE